MTDPSTFDQRVRDAKTLLVSHWPPGQPRLADDLLEIVAVNMVNYAIQCELAILNERDESGKSR
jgi:hypothetical protein